MKNILYTLSVLLVFGSCKNIEKLVEKGQYDEAIVYATSKLAGQKNKKTKHVKALEKAFAKVTSRDIEMMEFYDAQNQPANWDRVYSLARKIDARQNRIKPFLPLISKEGYEANFKFVKTQNIMTAALDGSAKYNYDLANQLLEKAYASNNKSYARQAYETFNSVENYRSNYLNTFDLKEEAYALGVVHINIETDKYADLYAPQEVIYELNNINVYQLNSKWRKYYFQNEKRDSFDFTARLELMDIDVSPERETVAHHKDTKRVKDGWKYVKTKDGKIKKDSLGNKIKVDVFKKVKANVTEITREKASYVNARFLFIDNVNGQIIKDIPLNSESIFNDYALQFRGDKRALCEHDLSRLKPNPLPFPFDVEMIINSTRILKEQFKNEVRSVYI